MAAMAGISVVVAVAGTRMLCGATVAEATATRGIGFEPGLRRHRIDVLAKNPTQPPDGDTTMMRRAYGTDAIWSCPPGSTQTGRNCICPVGHVCAGKGCSTATHRADGTGPDPVPVLPPTQRSRRSRRPRAGMHREGWVYGNCPECSCAPAKGFETELARPDSGDSIAPGTVPAHCTDHSQYGQTKFILDRVTRALPKTFVEFGCRDGTVHSNTKMLECRGWKGACVEPIETIHSRKHGYQGAICSPQDEGTRKPIIIASAPGLHGTNPDLGAFHHHKIGTKNVQCLNLDHIVASLNLSAVGYITIDTEGSEEEIIKAYWPLPWATNFVQVECNTDAACSGIRRIMSPLFSFIHFFPFNNGRGGGDTLWHRHTH